jgi:hypothetical protein
MATADEYAKWIVDNADKKGTPDFEVVSTAYKLSRSGKTEATPDKGFSTSEMLLNAPQSLWKNTIGGLSEVAAHPLNTAQSLMDLTTGGIYNAMPAAVQRGLTALETSPYNPIGNPAALQRAQNVAGAVGRDYANTYGSAEGFKQTMQQDPFRVLGDVSTVLGGTGAALKAGGFGATSGKVANALATASDLTNPINALVKPIALGAKYAPSAISTGLGLSTGVGADTIKTAFESGLKGKTAFKQNMRGEVPITQVLDDAKANLSQMNLDKQAAYRSGMINIANDKTVLDFSGIDKALQDAEKYSQFKGKVVNKPANDILTSIQTIVDDWKQSNPTDFHTPEGLDKLKQTVWGEIEKLPKESKTAFSAGKEIYNAIKNEISSQAPEYSKVMKEYTDASELTHEIERALSLGNKASADTALRKLQSLTRNNVTTNYGGRQALAQQLSDLGGNELMPALAGQAMSSTAPRNLAGQGGAVGAGLAAFSNPWTLAAMPFMSPRLMGEAAYGAGQFAAPIQNALAPTIANAQRLAARSPMTAQQAKLAALMATKVNPSTNALAP